MLARALLLAMVLVSIASPARAQLSPADVQTSYPTFGVTLTGPAGWFALRGGGPGRIAYWGKADANRPGQLAAVVSVEAEPIEAEPDTQYAQRLAQRMGAKVAPGRADLAGAKAFRLTVPPAGAGKETDALHPVAALVAKRGKYAYVISAFETPNNPATEALDAVRSAWKWVPFEPVTRHLQEMSEPFPVMGKLSIRMPAIARPFDVQDPKSQAHLAIYDYVTSTPVMDFEVMDVPTGGDPARMRDVVAQSLSQQIGLAQPFKWIEKGGTPRRWVSGNIDRTSPGKGPGAAPVVTVARYAFVELNERDAGLMTLQYVLGTPGDRDAYEAANESIVRSIALPSSAADAGSARPDSPFAAASAPPAGPRGDGSIKITRKAPRAPAGEKSPKP